MSQPATTGSTPMLPAREPDGWWMGHTRYRNYVLFAASGFVLLAVNVVLLLGIRALATGVDAWRAYLGALGSLLGLPLVLFLLVGTTFFSLRWLWLGQKVPAQKLGPLPAPSMTLILIANFAALATVSLLLLALLSGLVV